MAQKAADMHDKEDGDRSPRGGEGLEDGSASQVPGRHGNGRAQESRDIPVPGSPRATGTGYDTPSEPRSPPRHAAIDTPNDSPYYSLAAKQQEQQELYGVQGPMCVDPWDWKTDAPVFVPGGDASGFMPTGTPMDASGMGSGFPAQGTWAMPQAMAGTMDGMGMQAGDWSQMGQSDNLRDMRQRMNQLEIETAQVKASWENERRNLVRQISHYRAVLERYCIPVDEAGPSCMDGSYDHPGAYYTGFEPTPPSQWGQGGDIDMGGQPASALDSKMRQLSNMLQESGQRRRGGDDDDGAAGGEASGKEGYGFPSGSIESTLRSMFPHAKVRTSQPGQDSDGEAEASAVIQQLRRIESLVGSQADDRALKALQAVDTRQGLEALVKVEELVNAQGGQCRNLSSILQSVCRKIEKAGGKGKSRELESSKGEGKGLATAAGGKAAGKAARRTRKGDEDGDAFDAPGREDSGSGEGEGPAEAARPELARTASAESESASKLNTPAGRRSNRSWADMHSGDEDEGEPQLESLAKGEKDTWTEEHANTVGRKGFELRRKGDGWQLKISMSGLEPKLTQRGMERYCRWLQGQLKKFAEEHGAEALKHCRGEIDFSHNDMTNEMLWALLETLAQHKVHTACLKLFANKIALGGILALCEFIRGNPDADPIQELHLSHNEIDDEAALELMRILHAERPRYPPERLVEETGETVIAPVWLRLNHNRIRDTEAVRKAAEQEGITLCPARDRNTCGTTRCSRKETPLLHLHSFGTQSVR